MGIEPDFQNPWGPGGHMYARTPWAQPSLQYGWGHGNEYFTPKTKAEIQKEALLQLAVLAVVVAAPALAGAISGAGGATATKVAGGVAKGAAVEGASMSSAIASASLQTSAASAAATAGSGAFGGVGAFVVGGGAAFAALQPFLEPGAADAIGRMLAENTGSVNRFFHNQPSAPQYTWLPTPLHPASNLLNRVAEEIQNDPIVRRELQFMKIRKTPVDFQSVFQLVGKSLPISMGWPESFEAAVQGRGASESLGGGNGEKLLKLFSADPKYQRSLGTANWFNYDQDLDTIARFEYGASPTPEGKIEVLERYFSRLVDVGRNDLGWVVAANHLDYFLNGNTGPDGKLPDMVVDPQYLFQFPRVREAVIRGTNYIFDGNYQGGQEKGLLEISEELEVGERIGVNTFWQAAVDYPGSYDLILGQVPNRDAWDGLAYAMGGFTIDVHHRTTMDKVSQSTTLFEGEIEYLINDPYDWHVGLSVGSESGNIAIDDRWAQKLVEAGRANTFTMKSRVGVNYSGTIVNGKLQNIEFSSLRNGF